MGDLARGEGDCEGRGALETGARGKVKGSRGKVKALLLDKGGWVGWIASERSQ